ncbi:isoleucine--tRNA ligase [Spiroplasma turonicum]|uniref:Isoleucine--tRNA ligase n=1 Tax=Spiroplasma turonicum TaxID=216946 RepID=A0A0K1P5Q1_9MOLU|nr:isoleucine--tRNA ligase [Spiroplasma turonicum]AKU79494.1 isoleucyl-tRNA synthetase [Spiroplasma turonicum]ALX70515.1 isoleucyl-tRNA synthetase [Spiroplasma turonicum]
MEKNYKDTLLMYQTDFDMKADLKLKEPIIEEEWTKKDIYNKKINLNKGKKSFVLHDGPPYANGNIHVGHALNKILKDIIVRWKNYTGYCSPYIMGWDTHGLPIETAVTKTGVDRKKTPPVEFRELCKKYALEQIEVQSNQFRRLGIFSDYDKKYLTLSHDFEMSELKLYKKMVEKNLIYRDLKPIYWSPSSESALAEAEIEYKEVRSPSIYVACEILNDANFKNTFLVFWTTTPWTVPSNQLIALGEDLDYALVENLSNNKKYIVANDLVENFTNTIELENFKVNSIYKGKELTNLTYKHPWYENKTSFTVLGHHVTSESGTGLVHIAGGFGEDDFEIVKSYNIKPFAPIDNQGKFDVTINDKRLEGVFYEDANKIIGEDLEKRGILLKLKFVKHSYPHDWRTKLPIIFRATSQWFVGLSSVKDEIDNVIVNQINTNPEWSKERLRNIIKERNDWTISRQRLWGVPIIAFFDENKKPILDNDVIDFAIKVIEKEGTNSWFSNNTDHFLPEKYKNKGWEKEKDILDVWFDSGSSNIALEQNFGFDRPFDLYLEGNDQYRGWFNSSLINSVVYDGKPAYKFVITHGMTNDEKGKKMSKSVGNVIDPIAITDDLGADILRLWVFTTDFTDDQRLGKEIIKQVSESYRKIRNTLRFLLNNLVDFDPNINYKKNLEEVDKYALHKLSKVKEKFINSLNIYNFNQGFKLLNNYIVNDLSSFYLDFIKDIIYVYSKDSLRRRQVQTVMYEQLWALLDMLKPVLVHTVEEVYQNMSLKNKEESIHLLDNKEQNFKQNDEFDEKWQLIMKLKDIAYEALEQARNNKIIKKNFDAVLKIKLNNSINFVKEIKDLNKIFIVNSIIFEQNITNDNDKLAEINVELKVGQKCARCWTLNDNLIDGVCNNCYDVLKQLGEL